MAKIVAELKPRDRALLWLAGRRGVKVMLFRARKRLRDLLQTRGLIVKS